LSDVINDIDVSAEGRQFLAKPCHLIHNCPFAERFFPVKRRDTAHVPGRRRRLARAPQAVGYVLQKVFTIHGHHLHLSHANP
jgi:hypothetical protein